MFDQAKEARKVLFDLEVEALRMDEMRRRIQPMMRGFAPIPFIGKGEEARVNIENVLRFGGRAMLATSAGKYTIEARETIQVTSGGIESRKTIRVNKGQESFEYPDFATCWADLTAPSTSDAS